MPKLQEEDEPKLKEFDTVIENTDMVEKLCVQKPDARKKKLYKEWEAEISYYANRANTLAGFKIYDNKSITSR